MSEKKERGDIHITNNYYAPIGQHIDHVDTINFRMDGDGTFHFGHVEEMKAAPKEKTAEKEKPAEKVAEAEAEVPAQESFVDRVKAIIGEAATKNGQRIESNAKGHAGAYIYKVNAEAFCRAMDDMVRLHEAKLKSFLGGTLFTTQVTKVCFFLGHVVRMNLINDANLQMADLLFAFKDYYPNLATVKSKLSDKSSTDEERVLMGTFEGLLRKYTA